jgi:demethylmenaquinone methyltransferase/2-methoxy-6-polyprenyl-1,4-benzoquinol methylase
MDKGIRNIFSEVPETYELINHILTFGLDILWRKKAAKIAVKSGGTRWLDICTGTGEMALYLCRFAKNGTNVYAADFSFPMLKKAYTKPKGKYIKFLLSDVKKLPFPDNTFDLITISFATRNINVSRNILIQSFKEFYRILRINGRFVNLETSQPSYLLTRKVFHTYVRLSIKPIGSLISSSKSGYTYLANSIPRFYHPEDLRYIMYQAGFKNIRVKKLMLGAAAIHKGIKL